MFRCRSHRRTTRKASVERPGSVDLTTQEGFRTFSSSSTADDTSSGQSTQPWNSLMAGDKKKKTPLWEAVESCDKSKAEELIGEGANLSETDRRGNTLLHVALYAGHFELARFLMQYFHNCSPANDGGVTPLHILAECNTQTKLARKFIYSGAKVNVADKTGRTPLMLASKRGFHSMVCLLLKHGAHPKAKDLNGWTASDYASVMGYNEIADIIEKQTDKRVTLEEEEESYGSTTDEEDPQAMVSIIKGEKYKRIIPIKMKRKYHSKMLNKLTDREEVQWKSGKLYDSKGNLLPVPEVMSLILTSANNLTGLRQWMLQQQETAEIKSKKCKQLQEGIDLLLQERTELLHERENLKNDLITLIQVMEDAPEKSKRLLMEKELVILKEGMAEMENEHDTIIKEVEDLNTHLEEERETQRVNISNHEAKMEDLTKEKKTVQERLEMLHKFFLETVEELDTKLKFADEIEENVKILLRVTYNLLRENQNQMIKVLESLEKQKNLISHAKRTLTTTKDENMMAGKCLDQIEIKMVAVLSHMNKIQNQLENHPLVQKLIEVGVIDDAGNKVIKATSQSEDTYKKTVDKRDEFDPMGILSLSGDHSTALHSAVEAMRYSWIDAPVKQKSSRLLSVTSNNSEPREEYSAFCEVPQLDSSFDKPMDSEEHMSNELKSKLNVIMAKHKR